MSDAYLIEVRDLAVGLVARDANEGGYRFHAAIAALNPIDGQIFRTPAHAQRAAERAWNAGQIQKKDLLSAA